MQHTQRVKYGTEGLARLEYLATVDGFSHRTEQKTRRRLVRQFHVTAHRVHDHGTQRGSSRCLCAGDECTQTAILRGQLLEVGLQHGLERQQLTTGMAHLNDPCGAATTEEA